VIGKHACAFALALAVAMTAATPAAFAGKPSPGGAGGSCTRKAPGIAVDNSFAWGAWGSWGTPGQQLKYAINVINYDVGCRSSDFVVGVSAPSGFAAALPTSTVTVKSSSSFQYLYASVSSPASAADGDYPLGFNVRRAGGSDQGAFTSHYKVYSSDSTAPTLYWAIPGDGATISGRSYDFSVESQDDHAVKKIELYVDGTYRSTSVCDNVSFECGLHAPISVPGPGRHTATFKSYDWLGNLGSQTVSFTVA